MIEHDVVPGSLHLFTKPNLCNLTRAAGLQMQCLLKHQMAHAATQQSPAGLLPFLYYSLLVNHQVCFPSFCNNSQVPPFSSLIFDHILKASQTFTSKPQIRIPAVNQAEHALVYLSP